MKIIFIPYTFNILAYFFSFSWQIIHLKNLDMYTFGGESEKVYVLYTYLNVDNYGRIGRICSYSK